MGYYIINIEQIKVVRLMIFKLKSKVLYKWIISYILILIIPIFVGSALLINTQKIVVNVYKVMNQALFQQIGKAIDNHFSQMDTVRSLLLTNTEINYFVNLMPETAENNWYSLVRIQKQISSYASSYNINKFYIYFMNIDAILTPSSLYSRELTFTTYHKNSSMEINEWFDYISQTLWSISEAVAFIRYSWYYVKY